MRALLSALVALALAAAVVPVASAATDHGPHGAGPEVSIGFSTYSPPHLDVLAGDAVRWTNSSVRTHTVTADDGSFDSDRIVGGGTYTRRFDAAGAYPYYCRLHAGIRGEVDAHVLLLDPQPESAAPGRSYPLSGRAALPQGTEVSIEGDSGGGFAKVGTASVAANGSFSTMVTPAATTSYRAVHGADASPPVELLVLDRSVQARAARHGRAVVVSALVAPASPGQTVVLERRLRERFGWWPLQRSRLDSRSRVRFVIHTRGRVSARVVLTRADGATQLALSPVLRVGPGR